ncbi:MAG: EFR1 family ferrodoxin [Clostridiales bacterium]|jgi:ferredoxin|nr:EFR1 family ferrodoxin [Clostridiales bacterium]
MMLTVYFSGTGNTAYIAELFAAQMGGKCLSIEDEANFSAEFAAADTIAFCYPIYGSRAPLIMRQFAARHSACLQGKKVAIFVTQLTFSGDGAMIFADLFPKGHFHVIYAAHFYMPNNICNFSLLRKTGENSIRKRMRMAENKVARICRDISGGIVRLRGASGFARLLGNIQGKPWQGDSTGAEAMPGTMEAKAKAGVKIDEDCTVCGLCIAACPMKNLEMADGAITHNSNCTVCYRCVNLCPHRAITTFFHSKPQWQYKGLSQKS